MTEPRSLYTVPEWRGCDGLRFRVTVHFPFVWELRAASYAEAIELAKLGPGGADHSIGYPLDTITAELIEEKA